MKNIGYIWGIRNPNMALSPSRCVLCKEDSESIDHLLMHCKVAGDLWKKLFREAGFLWVFPERCNSFLVEEVFGFGTNKMARALWKSMVMSLMWTIWLERNDRIFNGKELEQQDIFEKARFSASLWASTDKAFKGFSLNLIVNNWKDVIGR